MSRGAALIPNDALINALRRSCKFEFKNQSQRIWLYKKKGGTKRVEVQKRDFHEVEYARAVLRNAGMPPDEIEKFISEVRVRKN
jgi:hypothetical protein